MKENKTIIIIIIIIIIKLQIPYYHPLNLWLLWATNGNQEQTVMHLQCSETINHL